jgi:hypothetical protein
VTNRLSHGMANPYAITLFVFPNLAFRPDFFYSTSCQYFVNVQLTCHVSSYIIFMVEMYDYLPETLIFFTVLFELFAMWTLTAMFSPW